MDRVEEMRRLRFQELLTNTEIGLRQNPPISRERVRQLIGNTGRGFVTARRKRIWEENKYETNQKLSEMMEISESRVVKGYREGEWHNIKSGNVKTFQDAQKFVSAMLVIKGYENEMTGLRAGYSFLLENGNKVQLIACHPVQVPRCWAKTYSFNTRAEKVGIRCDFFICLCLDTLDMFVVPSDKVRGTGTPIRFSFPPTRHYKSKWLQYHGRFDLLDTV